MNISYFKYILNVISCFVVRKRFQEFYKNGFKNTFHSFWMCVTYTVENSKLSFIYNIKHVKLKNLLKRRLLQKNQFACKITSKVTGIYSHKKIEKHNN